VPWITIVFSFARAFAPVIAISQSASNTRGMELAPEGKTVLFRRGGS